MTPQGKLSQELSPMHNPVITSRLKFAEPVAPQRTEVDVAHEALLVARRLRAVTPDEHIEPVPPLEEDQRKSQLSESKSLDFHSAKFTSWLDANHLRPGADEEDVDFARRVFTALIAKYTFEIDPKNPTVTEITDRTKADCDGIGTLFIATLRANDVPARILFGIPAESRKPENNAILGHAFVEFFADGVGWVPVEIGLALQHKGEPNQQPFFGFDPGRLVVQHVGCDLQIPTPGMPQAIYSFHSLFVNSTAKGHADVRIRPVGWDVVVEQAK